MSGQAAWNIPLTEDVLDEVLAERTQQMLKWGEQNHPDGTSNNATLADAYRSICQTRFRLGVGTWKDVLREEVYEAFSEVNPAKLREELIQVAAVAVAWVEAIDRRE